MKTSKFTNEQIIGFHKQTEAGMPIKELCRAGGFSDGTFYKWRAGFGGMQTSDTSRLRALQDEDTKLSRIPAEANLDISALKGVFGVKRQPHKPSDWRSSRFLIDSNCPPAAPAGLWVTVQPCHLTEVA